MHGAQRSAPVRRPLRRPLPAPPSPISAAGMACCAARSRRLRRGGQQVGAGLRVLRLGNRSRTFRNVSCVAGRVLRQPRCGSRGCRRGARGGRRASRTRRRHPAARRASTVVNVRAHGSRTPLRPGNTPPAATLPVVQSCGQRRKPGHPSPVWSASNPEARGGPPCVPLPPSVRLMTLCVALFAALAEQLRGGKITGKEIANHNDPRRRRQEAHARPQHDQADRSAARRSTRPRSGRSRTPTRSTASTRPAT